MSGVKIKFNFSGEILLYEGPPMPSFIFLEVYKEENDMLKFKLVLPEPKAKDVVSRELSTTVAQGIADLKVVGPTDVDIVGFEGNQDDAVEVTLTDIDDAGNRSETRVQSFILVDTIAPPQPGEIGLVVTEEV